jgi:hypothetical protein
MRERGTADVDNVLYHLYGTKVATMYVAAS